MRFDEQAAAVGEVVVAHLSDGRKWGRGRVIAWTDQPTFEIECEDGSRFSWRADMCALDVDSQPRWVMAAEAEQCGDRRVVLSSVPEAAPPAVELIYVEDGDE